MKDHLVEEFIENLLTKSIAHHPSVQWKPLSHFQTTTQDQNEEIYYMLLENEFRTIIWNESFYFHWRTGYVFLVTEKIFSGRDGSITTSTTLFVQETSDSKIAELQTNTSKLDQLRMVISADTEPTTIPAAYIEAFLNEQ